MREKKDTCINSESLKLLYTLSDEEAGCLLKRLLAADDIKGFRFKDLSGKRVKWMKEKEKEVDAHFDELAEDNPIVDSAYDMIFSQVSKSRRSFDEVKKRMEDKYGAQDKKKQEEIETAETKLDTKNFIIDNGIFMINKNDETTSVLKKYNISDAEFEIEIQADLDIFLQDWNNGKFKSFEDIVSAYYEVQDGPF